MGTGFKGNALRYRGIAENIPTASSKYKYHNGRFVRTVQAQATEPESSCHPIHSRPPRTSITRLLTEVWKRHIETEAEESHRWQMEQ